MKAGCKMVKFGDVVKNSNLVERDPVDAGIDRIVGLDHIEPENLHIKRWDSPEDGTSFTRKFIPGQTLFGKRRAYQRKVAFAEFEGICSGDILTFESKNSKILLPELLPFICQTEAFFNHALGTSAGSLSPRTSWSALQNFEFPLPPLDEQKRIAEILWAADAVREKWIRTISECRKFLGVFSTHLEDMKGVDVISLGQMVKTGKATIINGPFGTVLKASSYKSEGTSLVNPTHIRAGRLDIQSCPKLDKKDTNRLARYSTATGDILLGRKGDMDKVLYIDKEIAGVITGSDCLRIRITNEPLAARFLYFWLRSPHVFNWLSRFAHGTTMPGINEKTLHHLRLPLPDKTHQKWFVLIFESISDQICKTEAHLEKASGVYRHILEETFGSDKRNAYI
jgi:type I restriction enzyme, S subunit